MNCQLREERILLFEFFEWYFVFGLMKVSQIYLRGKSVLFTLVVFFKRRDNLKGGILSGMLLSRLYMLYCQGFYGEKRLGIFLIFRKCGILCVCVGVRQKVGSRKKEGMKRKLIEKYFFNEIVYIFKCRFLSLDFLVSGNIGVFFQYKIRYAQRG